MSISLASMATSGHSVATLEPRWLPLFESHRFRSHLRRSAKGPHEWDSETCC